MPFIKRIKIQCLRNLTDTALEFSSSVNIFCGNNGSGKTSLLEAISLLGLGRSFRSHKSRNIIQYECEQLTIYAELSCQFGNLLSLGIQKHKNGITNLKMNGNKIYSSSLLAKNLPLQIIHAHSFQLLEGTAQQRRQFLDWMVFHVKPDFIKAWSALQKVIKHRNSLLRRDKISMYELAPWDRELIRLTRVLHHLRRDVFQEFQVAMTELLPSFIQQYTDFTINYYCGWKDDKVFEEVLTDTFNKDAQAGYTHYGPHRADLKIKVNKVNAVDILSRGQEKSLVCGLYIGQAKYYQLKHNTNCVFLIDDMLADLDNQHCHRLAKWLLSLNGQIFVTGTNREELLNIWKKTDTDIALFHVEQGDVTRIH